jgi:hypothetical protein
MNDMGCFILKGSQKKFLRKFRLLILKGSYFIYKLLY